MPRGVLRAASARARGKSFRSPAFSTAPLGSRDRGDVRVDQDDIQALFLEGLDGLAAGVVELSGLPDLEGATPQDEDLFRLLHPAASRKASKRNSVSVGPGQASGWNWTPKTGRGFWGGALLLPAVGGP